MISREDRVAAMEAWLYSVLPERAPVEADIHTLVDIRSLPGSNEFRILIVRIWPAFPPQMATIFLATETWRVTAVTKGLSVSKQGSDQPKLRSYADYMATEEFREGVHELIETA